MPCIFSQRSVLAIPIMDVTRTNTGVNYTYIIKKTNFANWITARLLNNNKKKHNK